MPPGVTGADVNWAYVCIRPSATPFRLSSREYRNVRHFAALSGMGIPRRRLMSLVTARMNVLEESGGSFEAFR